MFPLFSPPPPLSPHSHCRLLVISPASCRPSIPSVLRKALLKGVEDSALLRRRGEVINGPNRNHSLPPSLPPAPLKVFELQPDIAWDKGKAVLWLLDKLVVPMALAPAGTVANGGPGINGTGNGADDGTGGGDDEEFEEEEEEEEEDCEYSDRFFTVFIGDDKTDEVRAA